jgi:hypothetical protein
MRFREIKALLEFDPQQNPLGQPNGQPMGQNNPPAVQQPQPAPIQQPVNNQDPEIEEVKQELIDLVDKVEDLPNDASSKQYTIELLKKIAQHRPLNSVSENDQHPLPIAREENLQNLLKAALQGLTPEMVDLVARAIKKGEQLSDADLQKMSGELSTNRDVRKASTSYEKTIELDTKGEIVQMDTELENYAAGIAQKLGLDLKWARNLVGMFGVNISREDRLEFLKLCSQHKAFDIKKMLSSKHGKLSDLITKNPPSIREVFQHVKGTLLDISLSTGQRDATGPFEAMLCIMGGAVKLSEKGDVRIGNQNYEVKGSSITIKKDTGAPGVSNAWLEGQKMKGGTLKGEFFDILANYLPPTKFNKKFTDLVKISDFRSAGIESLQFVLNSIPSRSKSDLADKKYQIMRELHSKIFPATSDAKIPKYNFNTEIQNIVNYIDSGDYHEIAKIQGTMGILEYFLNDYQSGMIFYNSSTETYRVLSDINDIVEMSKNPAEFGISFDANTVTMLATKDKAGPGVYFGGNLSSPDSLSYINKSRAKMGLPDYKRRSKK